jgi:hypothetical protein
MSRQEQVKAGLRKSAAKKTPVDPAMRPKLGDLKAWHIPQVPMKSFDVIVRSPQEGKFILDVLANYDLFQLANNIKPDYSNAGGLLVYDGEEWVDWYDADGQGIDETETFVTDPYLIKKKE